jgi:hypothetical protein
MGITHGNPPPGPIHREDAYRAFKELLDEREQARTTEIKVPMCTSFKPTDTHEVDIHDHRAVAEMKKWPYRQI